MHRAYEGHPVKIKLVEISWIDARASEPGWVKDDPSNQNIVLKTYGLLVRKDKRTVVHASTYDPETKLWSERGEIPAGMVLKIRTIETVTF